MPNTESQLWKKTFPPGLCPEVFFDNYSEGLLQYISYAEIPPIALTLFERLSTRFILPEEYRPGDFTRLFLVSQQNGDHTFGASQMKRYPSTTVEELTYLADLDPRGNIIGKGEMRMNFTSKHEYFLHKPAQEWSESMVQRRGLAVRRARLLNALAKSFYDAPLYSGTFNFRRDQPDGSDGERVWKKLWQMELVEHYLEGGKNRYVFK